MLKVTISTALSCLVFHAAAQAAQIDGVSFADTITVGGKPLVLNGVALNRQLSEKIYVAALYMRAPQTNATQALASTGAKRLEIVFLRQIPARGLSRTLISSMRDSPDHKALTDNVNDLVAFGQLFDKAGARAAGDRVAMDWVPERGLEVRINDKLLEPVINNEVIYRLLLGIFIGPKAKEPVRTGLLAGTSGTTAKK
jgi:hypothetical protein